MVERDCLTRPLLADKSSSIYFRIRPRIKRKNMPSREHREDASRNQISNDRSQCRSRDQPDGDCTVNEVKYCVQLCSGIELGFNVGLQARTLVGQSLSGKCYRCREGATP